MALFGDLTGEIVGRIPGLSPFLAQTFINRAYQKIREEREWSWLQTDGAVLCPAVTIAGTANIVQFSNSVTMSIPATTALNLIPNPPGLTAMQIRFMGFGSTSQIYNIVSFVPGPPIVLTLDRAVQEPTAALSPYMVYRAYIVPPITDFKRWISLVDMVNGIRIVKGALSMTSALFDVRDPQRQALGMAYYLGFYKGSSAVGAVDSRPIYELWPHSTQGQTWYVRFQRRGLDPLATDPVPSVLPEAVIVEGALYAHAYPHCMANIGHFPSMVKVNWTNLITLAKNEYHSRLQRAKITDDDVAMTSVTNRGHGLKDGRFGGSFPYPIDANFFQSHPIFW